MKKMKKIKYSYNLNKYKIKSVDLNKNLDVFFFFIYNSLINFEYFWNQSGCFMKKQVNQKEKFDLINLFRFLWLFFNLMIKVMINANRPLKRIN